MATYHYGCVGKTEDSRCTIGDYAKSKADGFTLLAVKGHRLNSEPLVWEMDHPMANQPVVTCPVCGGPTGKHYGFMNVGFHIRGNWALDKAGCKREMDLHKLNNPADNVYDEHYEPGERDDIKNRLKKAGRKAMNATRERDNGGVVLPVDQRKMPKKKATIIRLK